MTIRAVVFDVYGTLLEVGPPPPEGEARWQHLCRDLLHAEPRLTRLGFSIACSQVIARNHAAARARGIAWPEVHWLSVVTEVLPEVARLPRPDQAAFVFHQIQTGHTTHMTAVAADTLRWLQERRCPLGIASNAQAYTLKELDEALRAHGLGLDLFERDLCFWSFEHGFSKPDPHVLQILTARLAARGIGPGEALLVGDRRDNDIEPAQACGWRAWHLTGAVGTEAAGDWPALRRRLHFRCLFG